jgi:hypothetical protein
MRERERKFNQKTFLSPPQTPIFISLVLVTKKHTQTDIKLHKSHEIDNDIFLFACVTINGTQNFVEI